jgi:uncharacterized protein YjbJ (UPF0337 family)
VLRVHFLAHCCAQLTTVQVGGAVGSDSMQRDGKEQHAKVRFPSSSCLFDPLLTTLLQGETEKKTAQTADATDGLMNQIAGTATKLMGKMTGDQSQEMSG